MERYHVIGGHLRLDPEGTVTSYADAQRALDAEREKVKRLSTCGTDHSTPWWQVKCEDLEAQLATLQAQLAGKDTVILQMGKQAAVLAKESMAVKAQLRQVEGERDGLEQNCLNNHVTTEQADAKVMKLEGEKGMWASERIDLLTQLENAEADLTMLRQLVEVHTKQLTELTIIPIGCSREQELRWTQSIKDLRATLAAQDAGKVSTSIIGKQVPPSQWNKNAGVSGDVS